jgi:hypothetical protein
MQKTKLFSGIQSEGGETDHCQRVYRLNILIDPFMTTANAPVAPEPPANLLRAPVLAQRHLGQYPGLVIYPWSDFVFTSAHGESEGLVGSITPIGPVLSALTGDRGFVNVYNLSKLGWVMSCFHQGTNLVSLFLGKLCVISHVRSSCLVVRNRLVMLLQLAFLASGGVALRT